MMKNELYGDSLGGAGGDRVERQKSLISIIPPCMEDPQPCLENLVSMLGTTSVEMGNKHGQSLGSGMLKEDRFISVAQKAPSWEKESCTFGKHLWNVSHVPGT